MNLLANLTPTVQWTIAGIFGCLLLASAITWTLVLRRPEKDYSELVQRVKTWWIMVIVFTIAIVTSRTVSLVFFGLISFLAIKEYFTMMPTRQVDRRVLLWIYLAVPLQYIWAGYEWYGMFIIFIPVYLFLFLPTRMILIGEMQGFIKSLATLHWGAMTCIFSISHLAYLLVLPADNNPVGGGPAFVLFLVILTQLNDVFQYIFGKTFGKHPIVPKVSPKKTVEGFIGGVLSVCLISLVLSPLLTPFSTVHAVLAGLLIGISGFIGDVSISALKRDLGLKDSGALLPGHGGILDRIDSLTYTAPLFFSFYLLFILLSRLFDELVFTKSFFLWNSKASSINYFRRKR